MINLTFRFSKQWSTSINIRAGRKYGRILFQINMPFKKFWSASSDPIVTSVQYSPWKRQTLKIWILYLQLSKYIPINLKGALQIFNGNFEGVYVPHSSQMWQTYHFWPKQLFETYNATMGSVDHVQFLFKRYNNSRLLWMYFDHGKNKIQIFFFYLSHRLCRGSLGTEDQPQFFKGHICSGGVKWNTFWPWSIWN